MFKLIRNKNGTAVLKFNGTTLRTGPEQWVVDQLVEIVNNLPTTITGPIRVSPPQDYPKLPDNLPTYTLPPSLG